MRRKELLPRILHPKRKNWIRKANLSLKWAETASRLLRMNSRRRWRSIFRHYWHRQNQTARIKPNLFCKRSRMCRTSGTRSKTRLTKRIEKDNWKNKFHRWMTWSARPSRSYKECLSLSFNKITNKIRGARQTSQRNEISKFPSCITAVPIIEKSKSPNSSSTK